MKTQKLKFLTALLSISLFTGTTLLISCGTDDGEEFDVIPPTIDVLAPTPCSIEQFSSSIRLHVLLSDNEGLGSYKLNIHHNFDHHTHGNHKEVCEMDDKKTPDKPLLKEWSDKLPDDKAHELDVSFDLPAGHDGGDYHALLYVTDINGNQNWTGISIKIE